MAEQTPPGGEDIEVDAPDGTRLSFPSTMSMEAIKDVMRRKYGKPQQQQSFQQPLQPMTTPITGADGGALSGGSAGQSVASQQPATDSVSLGAQGTPSDGRTFTDEFFADEGGAQPMRTVVSRAGVAQVPQEPTLVSPNRFAERVDQIEGQEAKQLLTDVDIARREASIPKEPVFLQYKSVQFDPQMLAMDPRESRITTDFEVLAPRVGKRKTQFTAQERQERIEQDAWTVKEENAYRGDALTFQAQLLRGRTERLKEQMAAGADPATLQAEAQDIDAGREYLVEQIGKLAQADRPSFAERLRNESQAISDKENSKGGDLARSYVFGATDAMRSALAGAARLVDLGEGYTTADKLSDWAASGQQDRQALISTKTKDSILGKVASGAGNMTALVMAGGAGASAMAGSALAMEYEGYVRQAMDDGATKQQAEAGAAVYAPISAAIEFVNPQLYFANKAGIAAMRKSVNAAIKGGMAPKEALRTSLAAVKGGLQEALEEVSQTATERATNFGVNELAGTELNTEITAKELGETALVSFILGGVADAGHRYATRGQRSKASAEAMAWAAQNPQEAAGLVDKYAPEPERDKFKERLDMLTKTYTGNGLNAMPPEQAAAVADVIVQKDAVKRDIKEAPMDPALESVSGDPRKKQEIALTMEAMTAMGIEPKKAVLALAGQGMLDMPEGAKVKKAADGTVDIEVKPAKEGEKPVTKKAIIDDLLAQVEALTPEKVEPPAIEEKTTGAPTGVPEGVGAVTPEAPLTEKSVRYTALRDASEGELRILRSRINKDDTATEVEKASIRNDRDGLSRFHVREKIAGGKQGKLAQQSRLPTVQEIDDELAIRRGEKDGYDQTDRRNPQEIEEAAESIRFGSLTEEQMRRYSEMTGSAIPDDVKRFVLAWDEYSKSPFGSSFYSTQQKDWDNTPDGSYRVADHWNFQATYPGSMGEKSSTIHAKTDKPVSGWAVARYNAKTKTYEVIREFKDAGPREKQSVPAEGARVVDMTNGKKGVVVAPHPNADAKKYVAIQWDGGKKDSRPVSDIGKWILKDEANEGSTTTQERILEKDRTIAPVQKPPQDVDKEGLLKGVESEKSRPGVYSQKGGRNQEEISRESNYSPKKGEAVLVDSDKRWSATGASNSNGGGAGSQAASERTRTPQEPQHPRQQPRESGIADGITARESSLAGRSTENARGGIGEQALKAGPVGAEASPLSSVSKNVIPSRGKRAVSSVLQDNRKSQEAGSRANQRMAASPQPEAPAEPVLTPKEFRKEAEARRKDILTRADDVANEDLGARGVVMRYFANGGRVDLSSFKKETGESKHGSNMWAWKPKKGQKHPSVEALAHSLWEQSGQQLDDTEIRNEIIDVLLSHENRSHVLENLKSILPQTEEEQVSAQLADYEQRFGPVGDASAVTGVSEQEIDALYADTEAEWDRMTAEQKQAIFDELDAAQAAAQDQAPVQGEAGHSVPRGQESQGAEGVEATTQVADDPATEQAPPPVPPDAPQDAEPVTAIDEKRARLAEVERKINRISKESSVGVPEYRQKEWADLHSESATLRKEISEYEKPERERRKAEEEAIRTSVLDKKAAEKAERVRTAPVFQRRNEWEIVKDGVHYVLRNPFTKEELNHHQSLTRVREWADEEKPQDDSTPTPTAAEVQPDAQVSVAIPAVEDGPVQAKAATYKQGKLIATGSTLDGVQKQIAKYYAGSTITLNEQADGSYSVSNKKGPIEGVEVIPHKGGFRFQETPTMGKAEEAARKAAAILERAKLKGDKLYALPIPPSVWNGAIGALQEVIVAGGKAVDAIAAAIKHIQASDWWKNKATQKEKDEVIDHLQGRISNLEAAIVAEDVASLKENIKKARSAGAKSERGKQQEARKEFVKTVRESLKELATRLSPAQVRAITASAARRNPASERSVAAFVRHAERIMANAQYAADVEKAKDYRKKAKKMSKRENVPLNHKEVLASMARMDVGALPDPAAFNAIAEQYMQQFAPMTQGYVPQSSADALDALAKMHESAAEERFKERTEDADDALAGAMAAESADEFAEGIEEDTKEKVRNEMVDMAEDAKFSITEQFDEEDLSGKERGILKKLKEADIEAMSLDQMREYIKTVDNIGINGSFDGAAKVAAMVEGVSSVSKAKEAVATTPLRRAWTGTVWSFFQQQFSSTSGLFRFLFGMGKGMAKFHNAIGATDLELSKKKYDDSVRDIKEKMADFYTAHRKKHKNADSAETIATEAMIAFAVQPVRGYDAEQSFDIQKRIIEQNIERLREKEKTTKEAELWQQAYDSMLKDAKSREDLLAKAKKTSPAAYESVMFLKDKVLSPYTDLLRAHKEQFWGEDFGENDMYLPITYRFFGKQEDLEPSKQGVFASDRVDKPKEAANLIGRKGVTTLPGGMVISPNLRRNVLTSSSRNLYDAYTSEVWQRINQFFKTPGAASVVGGMENLDYLNFGLKTLQSAQRREGGGAQDKMDRAVGKLIQRARKYASHLALGGIRQFLQQPADQLTNAMVNVGPQLVGRSITQVNKARPLLALSSIGDRGELIGGTNWDNTLEAEMASLARSLQGGLVDRFDAATEKIQRAIMFALTKSDVVSARTAWIAYYTKYIEENGGELMDWQKEADAIKDGDEFRREALAYATVNTDVTQGSSDPTKMARIAQHGGNSWQSLAKGVLNPFSSFTIGMRERITNDIADIAYGGNMYDENGDATPHGERAQRAARSLTATIAANTAFTAIRVYAVKAAITAGAAGLRALMQSAFGGDDEEKDDAENRLAILALIFNLAHTMKMMDADIYRTVAEAYKQEKRENSNAPSNTDEEESIKKAKLAYTSFLQSMMVSGYTPFIEAGSVDAINRMGYYIQLLGSDPALTSNGAPMKYESWVKQPENPPLYRTGQGYDGGDYGVMSVIADKMGTFGDQAQELLDTANDTPERKEARKLKEQKKERMTSMEAIADQVASGAMTWEEAMKSGREQLEKDGVKERNTNDPQAEYINHLKKRIIYDRAPQWVKGVMDESTVKARVKLARKKLNSLSGEERVKEKAALKDAGVWTDGFDDEWERTK